MGHAWLAIRLISSRSSTVLSCTHEETPVLPRRFGFDLAMRAFLLLDSFTSRPITPLVLCHSFHFVYAFDLLCERAWRSLTFMIHTLRHSLEHFSNPPSLSLPLRRFTSRLVSTNARSASLARTPVSGRSTPRRGRGTTRYPFATTAQGSFRLLARHRR